MVARGLRAALVTVIAALALAMPAGADTSSEYGEVVRFGGFDSSAFNSGHYGGPLTPGTFLDPTGFAVDPVDNTVYVLDRTSSWGNKVTTWRIQEFSPVGAVLGTTTFTLPNNQFRASAVEALAVDHQAGRLYTLVVGSPPPSSPNKLTPVAQELLAWSTTPSAGGELQRAPGLASDPLNTTGGLVSDAAQLQSGPTPLYAPQGIAIDPLGLASVDDPVVIEASDLLPGVGAGNPIAGDTIVQQVATQTQGTKLVGDLLSSWSGASVSGTLRASWGPLGISTSPDGTLTVLLDASNRSATDAYVVKLKADLSEPTVLNSDVSEPPLEDYDEASMWIDESPYVSFTGVGVSAVLGAGAEIVQLSSAVPGGTGFYAADFASHQFADYQFSATAAGPEFWANGSVSQNYIANIGLRLLRRGANGAISDVHGATIANTLGNGTVAGPCNVGASEAALAAGSEGTLWVLDRGPRTGPKTGEENGAGRQIIELAPGRGRLCPQPSGTFTMTPTGGASKTGEETLTVPAGTQVTFDASSINRQNGKPFAYEWDLDGDATNGPAHDGFETINEMQPENYVYPPSTATLTSMHPGRYTVRARLRTEYGAYTAPAGTIIVQSPAHPEAQFTASVSSGSLQAAFDASHSTPGVGSISNYHWSWGDGSSEDDGPQSASISHTYAGPGSYTVTLTVTNTSYQAATSAPQTVAVEPPALPVGEPGIVLTGPLYAIPFPLYPIPPVSHGKPTRVSAQMRFTGKALKVILSCPSDKTLCVGTLRIETATAVAAGKTGARRHRPRRLLLGRVSFRLAGGTHRTVTVRLSRTALALLRRLGHLSVLLTVSAHDTLGDPGIVAAQFPLSLPVAHGGRARRRAG